MKRTKRLSGQIARRAAAPALLALAISACTPGANETEAPQSATGAQVEAQGATAAPPAAERSPYSPYAVHLADHERFHLVTFKDVGMNLFSPDRALLYEALAQSVALQMSVLPGPQWRAELIHDASYADPANHLSCESEHIYVDVWTGEDPDRWGYSLWSGCGEDDQFAWEELSDPLDARAPAHESVESLARRIVEELSEANESGCFTRNC